MKPPKIPIDYSKAGTGEAPFDGHNYLLHQPDGIIQGSYMDSYITHHWYTPIGRITSLSITHYTPMPEFEEIKNGQ